MTATTPLDAALDYAARGWRVVPILPGQKYPGLDAWQDAATVDPHLVADWYLRWPDHGVGIATGTETGFFVLDVDTGPGKNGDESLADLEATYGELPATVEVLTGSGGRHLYFTIPDGAEIRNDQGGRLGVGLDIRGDGGQVLAPPTVHPNGRRYEFEASGHPDDTPIADPPQWLVALLTRPPEGGARRERAPRREDHDDLPGTWWETKVTWPELLEADGASYIGTRKEHSDGTTYELWARPPFPNEDRYSPHTSASLYYRGSDVLKVFTSNWRGVTADGEVWQLDADQTYTRFGYYAARHHGGDHNAAARACHQMRLDAGEAPPDALEQYLADPTAETPSDEPTVTGWEPADVGELLRAGWEPVAPTVLKMSDGRALLYPGRINSLFGESGGGKSWLALVAMAQEMTAGHNVLYIDLEDHLSAAVDRLRCLGVTDDTIEAHFTYISPERAWHPGARAVLRALCEEHRYTLAVIDSTGEALAADGVKPNDDDAVTAWHRHCPHYIAGLGPAVLLLDHVPKDNEGTSLYAIGSQRKRAAVRGAAWRVEVGVAPAKGKPGYLRLKCAKDRHGNYVQGATIAEIEIDSAADGSTVTITLKPHEKTTRPTTLMTRVSEFLAVSGPSSKRTIEAGVQGKGAGVRMALQALVDEGYVSTEVREGRGGGFTYRMLHAFMDDQLEQFSGDESGTASYRVPTASPHVGDAVQTTDSETASPASRGSVQRAPGGTRFGRDEGRGTQNRVPENRTEVPSPLEQLFGAAPPEVIHTPDDVDPEEF